MRPADKLRLKAATIPPLVGLARSKQDPINRGHGAQYLYRPPPAGSITLVPLLNCTLGSVSIRAHKGSLQSLWVYDAGESKREESVPPASFDVCVHDAVSQHHDLVLAVRLGDEQDQQEYDNLRASTIERGQMSACLSASTAQHPSKAPGLESCKILLQHDPPNHSAPIWGDYSLLSLLG